MKHVLMFIWVLMACISARAQNRFSEDELVAVVKKYHPVSRAAGLDVAIARSNVLRSRGAFDPTFKWSTSQKEFDGATYYDRTISELKVPTWYGIDLYAGTENITGSRTNSDETMGRVSYAGFSVPLMQHLIIDKRRAALQTARLMVDETDMRRQSAVNDLLFDALQAYYSWWSDYNLYQLADSALKNAEQRFAFVKTAYQLGDRPAIDTTEALVQVQSFGLQKSDVFMRLQKSRWELSSFLWKENNEAYLLPDNIVPFISTANAPVLDSFLLAGFNHPELMAYDFKLRSLRIERRLKFQSLLPDVDLKYQQLNKGYDFTKTFNSAWFQNNYRFGISLAVPLRLSEGRGEYQQAKWKIEQATLQQLNKRVQVQTKIQQYFTEWQQTANQLRLQTNAVANYQILQRGEEMRFDNGESSLFLINAREQKVWEARQKAIELQAKNSRALAALRWASGGLVN